MSKAAKMHRQQLAEACVNALYQRDIAAQKMGIEVLSAAPGQASLVMGVSADMLNGHAICHGGFIFSLADTAFAYACNSHNKNTLAAGARIEYLAPARQDDILTATAKQRSQGGRTGIYDVCVCDAQGRTLALFRGNAYQIQGSVIRESDA